MNQKISQISSSWSLELSEVAEGLARELGDPEFCLLSTGSIAEGLATSKSDLDLILVSDTAHPPTVSGQYFIRAFGGRRAEILFFTRSDFSATLRNLPIASSSIDAIDYVHRITGGVPIRNSEFFISLKENFDRQRYLNNVKEVFMASARDIFVDYLGALSQGDEVLIASFSRRVLWACADALLVCKGDTYIREKWRLPRMRKAISKHPDLLHTFAHLEFSIPFSSAMNFDEWRQKMFSCCRRLMLEAVFGSEVSASDSTLGEAESYCGVENVLLSTTSDRYILQSPTRSFEVDTLAALVFLSLWRPLSLPSLRGTVSRHLKNFSDQRQIEERLNFLLENNLVEASASPNASHASV